MVFLITAVLGDNLAVSLQAVFKVYAFWHVKHQTRLLERPYFSFWKNGCAWEN